jgi:hypothetical protein
MKTFNFENQNYKDTTKLNQLERTANLLIAILKEKIKLQNDTYHKVLELKDTLNKLNDEYNKKLGEINKDNKKIPDSYELLEDDNSSSDKLINVLNSELVNLKEIPELEKFIKNMFLYLSNIDSSPIHIQNVYLLNRYPYEIDDINKKINVLNKSLKHTKSIFRTHSKYDEQIKEIDNSSECKKMVNINIYVENEKKRILEKYKQYEKVDNNILGDYIIDFEKLNIEIPKMIENNNNNIVLSSKEVIENLKSNYDKLNKKEKSACFIANSFLGLCLNELLLISNLDSLKIDEVIEKITVDNKINIFNEAYKTLDNYLNTNIRVKYFSLLKNDSFESFINSLINVLHILKGLNNVLKDNFRGFYTNKESELIPIYLKNIPTFNKQSSYLVSVIAGVSLYYSPIYISKPLDIIENTELEVKEGDFILMLKNKVIINTSEKSIIVVKYKKNKVIKKNNCVLVTEMKEKNKCSYYTDVIKNKEAI